ncbi:hypothetical protein [Muriicola sp.]|uniref:hypothetical protein n=1 Tax=Muriicola sp. TaxID=2020856 RepID=UPI003C78125F
MSIKSTAIFLSLIILMFSCKTDPKKDPTSSKMEEVMAVHDEVMPKMGTISRLIGDLKPKVDSTEMGKEYQKAMRDLQGAHTSMMDWMKGFGERFDHEEIMNGKELTAEKKEWLLEEEVKVNELKEQINNSIANAERMLAEN